MSSTGMPSGAFVPLSWALAVLSLPVVYLGLRRILNEAVARRTGSGPESTPAARRGVAIARLVSLLAAVGVAGTILTLGP